MPDVSQILVRVYNPKSQKSFTSRKSAQRYVARGLARWRQDGSVEFIDDEQDYRAVAVMSAQRLQEIGYDRDVSGARASLDAIAGLPVIGDTMKLFTKARTRNSVRSPLPVRRVPLALHTSPISVDR